MSKKEGSQVEKRLTLPRLVSEAALNTREPLPLVEAVVPELLNSAPQKFAGTKKVEPATSVAPIEEKGAKRAARIGVGVTVKYWYDQAFDNGVYPAAILAAQQLFGAALGPLVAFVPLGLLSAIVSYGELKAYDWSKKDWLGIELVKKIREGGTGEGLIARFARLGDVPAFFLLSIFTDPFVTTAYLRKGSDFSGLAPRDKRIFLASVFVSNVYWTLRWTAIISVVQLALATLSVPMLLLLSVLPITAVLYKLYGRYIFNTHKRGRKGSGKE
ncbi:MAG: hypothetical protein RLZZ283_226 [Candidatus Parcubacteria bacterium]